MRIGLLSLAVALCLAASGIANAQAPVDGKCIGSKIKCAINKQKGLIGCNAKAEKGGLGVDPLCVSKVTGKFSTPVTGCMEKADLKPPCRTLNDAVAIEAKIDAFVADIRSTLYLGSGIDGCSAAKDKCVINYVKGILGCRSKGITTGLGTDPLCVSKVQGKYATAVTGCMAKADLKVGLCQPSQIGNTAAVQAKMDAFVDDVECELTAAFPTGTQLNIVGVAPSGNCGSTVGGPSPLACGLSYTGGGATTAPPTGQPVGALTRLTAACTDNTCALGSTTGGNDCSSTGCPLGPYRSQANGATSSCVLVKFTGSATGTLQTCGGQLSINYPLAANVTITGNATQPCPLCVAGLCDATASNPGASCTDVGGGSSFECLPLGLPIPPFSISIPSNGTGTSTLTEAPPASGLFCPGQTVANKGCFGSAACSFISESGKAAGTMTPGAHAGTVAAAFCVPSTGNGVVDAGGGLPGPGASSTPDTFSLF